MIAIRKPIFATITIVVLFLVSCDPGHFGKIFIRNESSHALELKYKTHLKDTTITIEPNSTVDIFHFGGLGSGRDYDCCSCEFLEITMQPVDTSNTLIKNIMNHDNWVLSNSNERRFSNKEINCEFVIKPSDIK